MKGACSAKTFEIGVRRDGGGVGVEGEERSSAGSESGRGEPRGDIERGAGRLGMGVVTW